MASLAELLKGPIYQAYSYSYPHKTAYRKLTKPLDLRSQWLREDKERLFLYVHVPFCEMRCGFCNLLAMARPQNELVTQWLDALQRQAEVVSNLLEDYQFTRFAVGGGTPSYLTVEQLANLFQVVEDIGLNVEVVPTSVEVSPTTIDDKKLKLLQHRGVDRISIGIQSFQENELRAIGRPLTRPQIDQALNQIKTISPSVLNIDLIYGIPGQTEQSWLTSLDRALHYDPQELYLYPLYVRANTGLGRINHVQATLNANKSLNSHTLQLYRAGRDYLLSRGYQQNSMRMFSLPEQSKPTLEYSCQNDGMIGLGIGARSYTRTLHYSSRYASKRLDIETLINHYAEQSSEAFKHADYGYFLSESEQQRRFLLQSLFLTNGLDCKEFYDRFNIEVFCAFPELRELFELKLTYLNDEKLTLTATGLERSDMLAPWLASEEVKREMMGVAI